MAVSQPLRSTNHHPHIKTHSHCDLNIKTHSHRELHHQKPTKPSKFSNPTTSTKAHSPLANLDCHSNPTQTRHCWNKLTPPQFQHRQPPFLNPLHRWPQSCASMPLHRLHHKLSSWTSRVIPMFEF